MDMETCFSCIIVVVGQSISTMGTVTPPYQMTDAGTEKKSDIYSLVKGKYYSCFLGRRIVTFKAVSILDHCVAMVVRDSAPCWPRGI